jgi:hypothetical protein
MTPEQVTGFFDAGEAFVEGTIGAALVVLWLVALGLHLARPYMAHTTGKFTLRLGADLWWIIYVALRDIFLLQVFLGSFIYFYPDVITGQPLPVSGGLAAVCAFAALLIKLTTKGDADLRWFRVQVLLVALGATLYLVPYFFGVQATELTGQHIEGISQALVSSENPDLALPLCYLSAALAGILGVVAVAYNLRLTSVRRPTPGTEENR